MDDLPFQKVTISGPTLSSIIQRSSSSSGDIDGLLFGHVTQITPSSLPDDITDQNPSSSSTLVANITSHFSSGTLLSFYDSLGRLDLTVLRRLLLSSSSPLLGFFVSRRRTPFRPSMREFALSQTLKILTLENSPSNPLPQNSPPPPLPSIFFLLSTPFSDGIIHTHEYRAFQFLNGGFFEPRSLDVINIGPAFRGHYGAFSPISPFPHIAFGLETEDGKRKESLSKVRKASKEQKVLDSSVEGLGFEIGQLSRLVGSEAANYTLELEDLYGKMLVKLEGLARVVEKSSARVLEQENQNIKLRCKVAGLE
ncbi:BRISC complex subunit Abro1-like protein [Tasmannia lanceolata]|uniref:BRISC complex subunit Abro1-like protein n=1 Tax=Tasmannia lanceolata TaxID=3420 RepID=UPI004064442D